MKKVLALVLALTMVLGFASTTLAATYSYTNLFTGAEPTYTVGGDNYFSRMDVKGNKEYTVKATFKAANMAPYVASIDVASLALEYDAVEIIDAYYKQDNAKSWKHADLNAQDTSTPPNWTNPMLKAALAAGIGSTTVWGKLIAQMNADLTLTFEQAYKASSFQTARTNAINDYVNRDYGYVRDIAVSATSKDLTYATITSDPTLDVKSTGDYTVEFKVRFTNTTFSTKEDIGVEVKMYTRGLSQYDVYEYKTTLKFDVLQAQSTTFTGQDATIAFAASNNIEISANDYAYISADAFKVMKQNDNRSITVYDGMGQSKVRFDKDSTNLPQDVFVGNFKTSNTGSTAASISGFSSTTAAKIKIAVGQAFYTANTNKALSLFDVNGNKLDVEVTLQGDYTVNFFAPLSSYTVSASDWSGQKAPETGKTNPSMGGK